MAYIDIEVRRLVGRATHRYGLVKDGDRIAVAVSGGKDSLLLLWSLRERLRRIPIRYELAAIHIDLGFDPEPAARLETYFKEGGYEYSIIRTDYGLKAHSSENRENPCFLCARLRRAALFREARARGCRKIAFGHNQDDFIETFFLNICFGGQVASMLPNQPFFGGEISVIRPLALVPASRIEKLSQKLGLPVIPNPCPSADRNKRKEIRSLLEPLFRTNRKVRGNIFRAMSNINLEYLPPPLRPLADIRPPAAGDWEKEEDERERKEEDSLPY